jgi:hypothetical protein
MKIDDIYEKIMQRHKYVQNNGKGWKLTIHPAVLIIHKWKIAFTFNPKIVVLKLNIYYHCFLISTSG